MRIGDNADNAQVIGLVTFFRRISICKQGATVLVPFGPIASDTYPLVCSSNYLNLLIVYLTTDSPILIFLIKKAVK
jgi:hypothetical protein